VNATPAAPGEVAAGLRHYGANPLELDRARAYPQKAGYKPCGLWVSVQGEDDWPEWASSEGYGWPKLFEYEHRIVLAEDPNILHLSGHTALNRFTAAYRYPGASFFREGEAIDWSRVADEYNGIIIAPYVWSQRMDLMWYYGWDVASGCIWSLEAIASVERVHELNLFKTEESGANRG
jgi:hypothetical protein